MPAEGATGGLLERDSEVARLGALLAGAQRDQGGGLLVEGTAGIGKTALLALGTAVARERRMRCLTARGAELETNFGYGVVRQLFEGEVSRASDERRAKLLSGAAAFAAPLVTPLEAEPADPSAQPADAFAVLHGLYWLLANLADEAPVALFVDDLHWADAASLRFLDYLCGRIEGMPIALLAAMRLGESGAQDPLLDALRSEPRVDSIRLAKLSEGSVATLADRELAATSDPAFAHACFEVSRGNPFLLSELLQTLAGMGVEPNAEAAARVHQIGPPGIARSVLVRLARLGPAAVALAHATAVLGATASLRMAAALGELSPENAGVAADALVQAHVFSPGPTLEFHHPLIRTAIYEDLSAHRRSRAHRHAAALLQDDHALPELVANQLLLAEPAADAWAVDALTHAARAALARSAPDAAATYLRRAVTEPPPRAALAEVLHALGSASFLAGDPAGVEHLREALAVTEDPREWAAIALELGSLLAVFEQVPAAIELLDAAIARLDPGDPLLAPLQAAILQDAEFDITTSALLDARLGEAQQQIPVGSPQHRQLLATLAFRATKRGTADEAARLAERAIDSGRMFDEQGPDILRSMYAGIALILAERFDAAAVAADQFIDHARARGSLHAFDAASALRGLLDYRLGALADAEARARDALGAARVLAVSAPASLGLLLDVLVDRGDLDPAQAELDAAGVSDEWVAGSTTSFALIFLRGRARLRIARGDVESGVADLLEVGRRCELWGDHNALHLAWRPDAALALAQLGDQAGAHRLAEQELEAARRFGTPRVTAVALRTLAGVEGGTAAIDRLPEAAARLEDSPALLVRAQVLVDLGAALRRANQRRAAREPLLVGYELAHRCDARPLAERARDELQAIGARPRNVVRSGIDALTASERRVCALAAKGLTNPEIAQTLYVTRATVESHLHSAYRKLDVSTRKELGVALGAT